MVTRIRSKNWSNWCVSVSIISVLPRACDNDFQLKDASSAGRTADTSTLKKNLNIVITYTGVDPKQPVPKDDLPEQSISKHHLGFHNSVTGRLLCPVGLLWEDDEYVFRYCILFELKWFQCTQAHQGRKDQDLRQ